MENKIKVSKGMVFDMDTHEPFEHFCIKGLKNYIWSGEGCFIYLPENKLDELIEQCQKAKQQNNGIIFG